MCALLRIFAILRSDPARGGSSLVSKDAGETCKSRSRHFAQSHDRLGVQGENCPPPPLATIVSFCSRPDIKNVRRTVQPHQASLSPTGTEKSLDAPRVYRALRKVGSFRLNENAQLTSPPWRSDHTTGDGVAIHCREQ